MRLQHSDIMQCFHLPKQSERNTNWGGMCCAKKGGYSGLWQTCATSSRVLVVVNTCNKYLRPRYQHTFCQRRKTTRNAIVLIKQLKACTNKISIIA